jgi:uncharacterized protein (DUF488 family)
MKVYTIGYEGRTMEEVVAILRQKGIKTVVDVGRYALGKWSAGDWSRALGAARIGYFTWIGAAPSRKMRSAYRKNGDWDAYSEAYLRMLKAQKVHGILAVGWLATILERGPICLLCFEHDAARCHRSLLAEFMGWEAEHL